MSSTIPQQSDNDGPRPHLVISGHDDQILALTYLPDGQWVVTGSFDGTVKVWNVGNGEQEGTSMEHEDEVQSLVVTRDGTKIISSDTGGRIKVWDVESHELLREWTRKRGSSTIAVLPDDQLIVVGSGDVGIYTMKGKLVNDIEVNEGVLSVSFSPDGKKLACGTWDDIYVYDVDTGALVLGPLEGHEDWVNSVLWSRDGSRLFSGSGDNTIHCWNSDTGEQIGQPWTGHTHWIRSLSLSPDGSILASASWDKTVRFWDATSGHPIRQHLQHDKGVLEVCFSPSGESVASTEVGGNIYLWRVPLLDSVESRTGHATIAMTSNAVHYAQYPFFHAPPPYYMHFPSADQVLDPDLRLYSIDHRITSSAVSTLHSTPSIRDSNSDGNDSFGMSTVSDEVDVQSILPHPSLGVDECQRIFELRLRKLVAFATSRGLHVPGDLTPSNLPSGIQSAPRATMESVEDVNWNTMNSSRIEPSMSVFRSASNGDPKKIRKIDKIKQKLIEMLREIGFKLSKGRLPWSTLEGDLQKKGYMIVNWPQGVDRERDKGVFGISAEDADKLYEALFVGDHRIRFILCEESASNDDGVTLPAVASGSDGPRERNHSSAGNQSKFRVTTAAEYPNKRRRV